MIKFDHRELLTDNGKRQLAQLEKLILNSELKQGRFEAGDYIISTNNFEVPIEVKEFSEMIHSMDTGRLATQLGKCREMGESWFIREGLVKVDKYCTIIFVNDKKVTHTYQQIFGRLITQTRCGTMMLQSVNPEQTAYLIYYLHQYYFKDSHESANIRQYLSDEPNLTPQETALTAAYGIGPDTAKVLISHTGNIDGLCYLEYDELCDITGIGPEKAKAIYKLLHDYRK